MIVVSEGNDGDKSPLACAVRRQDVDEHHVVVDGEGRHGSAIAPYQVVLTPALAIAFEGEVGVIGDQIAVDILHALLDEAVRKILADEHEVRPSDLPARWFE